MESKLKKIEPRTLDFIRLSEKLKHEKKVENFSDIASEIDISDKLMSAIRTKRTNIQPDKWELFKQKFSEIFLTDDGGEEEKKDAVNESVTNYGRQTLETKYINALEENNKLQKEIAALKQHVADLQNKVLNK